MSDHQSEQEKIEQDAKALGKRLALLMAASTLEDEVKNAYMTLLPEMDMEQIDQLMQMLEKNVAGAAEIEAAGLVDNLEAIKADHAQKVEVAEKKALSEMAEIEKILDAAGDA
ncbi:hypothetical protein HOI83_00685 [Candidatus Uhrbacteria bacterium]|jgi:hypothetical protein|nr:hypothetical protein [Candidatus Uhrbacteria bacterium]